MALCIDERGWSFDFWNLKSWGVGTSIMDFFHETRWTAKNIYKTILGLLHTTGAIIRPSLTTYESLWFIYTTETTQTASHEKLTYFNQPSFWRPVFNPAKCQQKTGIPCAPWAVWMTLLVPHSFESLSKWLTSVKSNSDFVFKNNGLSLIELRH